MIALHRYHGVWWNLALREIRVRYKQAVLGVAWALVVPLAMMLVFTLVFTRVTGLASTLQTGMPYPIFLYIGLLPWVFFAQCLTAATNSLVANRNLVTKIYFPRQILPLATMSSCLFDHVIASLVLAGLIAYFHVFTEWTFALRPAVCWLPVIFVVQLAFTAGLALWFSLANLFYRDVKYLVAVLLQLWMFLTNVLYPLQSDDAGIQALIDANPMTPIIDAYRRCLIHGVAPVPGPFLAAAAIAVVVLVTGWGVFSRTEHKFAERV